MTPFQYHMVLGHIWGAIALQLRQPGKAWWRSGGTRVGAMLTVAHLAVGAMYGIGAMP